MSTKTIHTPEAELTDEEISEILSDYDEVILDWFDLVGLMSREIQ